MTKPCPAVRQMWFYALGLEFLDCAPHDLRTDRGQIATPEHGCPKTGLLAVLEDCGANFWRAGFNRSNMVIYGCGGFGPSIFLMP